MRDVSVRKAAGFGVPHKDRCSYFCVFHFETASSYEDRNGDKLHTLQPAGASSHVRPRWNSSSHSTRTRTQEPA